MSNIVVRARIDEQIKEGGLTVSDAFEPLVPNAETAEAMRAARRGDLMSAKSIDTLFADLNAGD